jgi:hypothetical protein
VTSLDEYLSGEFADFDRERKQIDEIIIKTIAALEGSFRKNRGWPYELSVAPNAHPNWPVRPSISTAAMIGAALAAASGRTEGALLSSNVAWRPETKRKEAADRASLKVARNALNLIFQSARLENESFTFYSGTFGADDVLTLCWLVDLHEALAGLAPTAAPTEAQAHENDGGAKSLAEVIERIFHRRTELHASDPAHIVRKLFRIEKTRGGSKQIELLGSEHAFPLLRTLQIKQWARRRVNDTLARIPSLPFVAAYDAGRWQDEFSRRVHEQLSFYAIPDSRFDPAELAFALEGLSLARPASLDRAVIKRAFRVLLEEQCRNPTL